MLSVDSDPKKKTAQLNVEERQAWEKAMDFYRYVGKSEHRELHEVTALAGERFPSCPGCSYSVSYTLIHRATYVYGNT